MFQRAPRADMAPAREASYNANSRSLSVTQPHIHGHGYAQEHNNSHVSRSTSQSSAPARFSSLRHRSVSHKHGHADTPGHINPYVSGCTSQKPGMHEYIALVCMYTYDLGVNMYVYACVDIFLCCTYSLWRSPGYTHKLTPTRTTHTQLRGSGPGFRRPQVVRSPQVQQGPVLACLAVRFFFKTCRLRLLVFGRAIV